MKRERDNQRSKLYKAEHVLWDDSKKFQTIGECEEYIKTVLRSRWFKNRYPHKEKLVLGDGRGMRRATAGSWLETNTVDISLPRWSRMEAVILHELSHNVSPMFKAAHGPEFASNFLSLVLRFMGRNAWVQLRESYKKHRVKWRINGGPESLRS